MTRSQNEEPERENRLQKIVDFLAVLDSFKGVERRGYVSDQSRHENDAEHTWHMCMFALLLHNEESFDTNLEHILKLILVHDLVEIYAGDTFTHDAFKRMGKKERENNAANRLFSQLPQDLNDTLFALWNEYEEGVSEESRFAKAIDKMQAFAQNVNSDGRVWKEHQISKEKIKGLNSFWSQDNETFSQVFRYLWETAECHKSFWSAHTNNEKVSVRPALVSDYHGFERIARDVHEHHVNAIPDVFRSVEVIVSEDTFATLLNDEDIDVFVAEHENEIVGYAVLLHRRTTRDMHVTRTFSFIDNFGVLKKSRRMGVGRMLFDSCLARAKEMGAETLELDCWEANQQAVRFYESMGMKVKRRWYSMDVKLSTCH